MSSSPNDSPRRSIDLTHAIVEARVRARPRVVLVIDAEERAVRDRDRCCGDASRESTGERISDGRRQEVPRGDERGLVCVRCGLDRALERRVAREVVVRRGPSPR